VPARPSGLRSSPLPLRRSLSLPLPRRRPLASPLPLRQSLASPPPRRLPFWRGPRLSPQPPLPVRLLLPLCPLLLAHSLGLASPLAAEPLAPPVPPPLCPLASAPSSAVGSAAAPPTAPPFAAVPPPDGDSRPPGPAALLAWPPAPALCPAGERERPEEHQRIGAIHVVTRNVFDLRQPGEGRRLFRWANRLHRTTRPEVVERQLLLRPGDPFSLATVRESERLLRSNPYLYDAAIRPVEGRDGTVDLDVLTRDVWTLQGGLSWNRAGGANTTEFNLEDGNFLGTGKDVTVARRANVDRSSNFFRYLDPNLAASRTLLDLRLANNSDGRSRRVLLDRPFFSLDTRWAAGVDLYTNDRVDSLYDAGRITARFRQRQDFLELYSGLSPGLAGGAASRWSFGYTYDRDLFSAAPAGSRGPAGGPLPAGGSLLSGGSLSAGGLLPAGGPLATGGPVPAAGPLLAGGLLLAPAGPGGLAPAPLPAARKLTYPWIAYDYLEDGYITVHDLNRIQRTEDVNLGRQLSVRLGLSEPLFGGGQRATLLKSAASEGWQPAPGRMLLALASANGRWEQGRVTNALLSGSLRMFERDWGDHVLYAALSGDLARRLDPESQLLLGGDSGLRGYPLRWAAGDRRLLFTLEQRFYSDREIFHLLYAGAAAFFDAGRAWFAGQPAAPNQRLLKDIGFGLRLCSSRSSGGSVVHLDVAYPLDRSRGVKGMQWLISTGESF
jgi:hypothetical protein